VGRHESAHLHGLSVFGPRRHRELSRQAVPSLPPRHGDVWRIDFSRFNQHKGSTAGAGVRNWARSRHGAWDAHIPEFFPYVRFACGDGSGPTHSFGASSRARRSATSMSIT
jgi:hypothetical protein